MLAAMKRLVALHNEVVAGGWVAAGSAGPVHEAAGRTLGIVGLGNIGKKVARRAQALDMRVVYHDIVRLTEAEEDALGVRYAGLDELLRAASVVSLHVPLDGSTRHLVGARELALMRQDAVLVNTCRGPVVDEAALHAALASGRLAGAASM